MFAYYTVFFVFLSEEIMFLKNNSDQNVFFYLYTYERDY